MSRLVNRMLAVDGYLHSSAVPFSGVQIYEVEPGNRPMKMFLANGYAALGMQDFQYEDSGDTYVYSHDMLQNAFRSGGLQETQNSIKYWSYQTRNGNRYWAEGPYYFEFTLNDVVPFWHSIRLNGMLNWNGNNISDPFDNGWFLIPLEWLADLTTQTGYLPPLDDGNKGKIRYANLLRWNNTYGDGSVGNKFAWIADKLTDQNEGLDTHTLLVQLAMPQVPENGGTTPDPIIGNSQSYINDNDAEQQLVMRHSDNSGTEHYLLLNGESSKNDDNNPGDAIVRGEGHEQPDQLQLLYYVDGTSFLMDRGYDSAGKTSNSSWNYYGAHNVMNYFNIPDYGGLIPPFVDLGKGRKVSVHEPVDELYYDTPASKITEFNVSQYLHLDVFEVNGFYDRNVLFIKSNDPYVIDFNSLKTVINQPSEYADAQDSLGADITEKLYYHGNSTSFNQVSGWKYWDIQDSNKDLYLYLKPVEFGGSSINNKLVSSEEINSPGKNIQRASIPYFDSLPPYLVDPFSRYFTTTAILKADNTTPNNINLIFAYDENNGNPHQGWYWKQDANTVDVIVKRSKVDMTKYNQTIDFSIQESDIFIPAIRLPGGKDYGFARFKKNNGVWELDSNYQVNLTRKPNTFVYANSNSIGNKTFPQNANVYLADNASVSITGDVTLQTGSTVYLGKDASIEVNNGGSMDADGTNFQSVSGSTAPADRWKHIKLSSGSNTFTNATIQGAEKGLYVASSNNVITGGYFDDNGTGIYLSSGDATLNGVIVDQQDQDGPNDGAVVRGSATLYLDARTSPSFSATTIRDLDRGIDISDYGRVVAYHTSINRNDYNVYITGDGDFDGGSTSTGQGYNSITRDPDTVYDIYNLSSNVASAQFNWWGSSTEPPKDWRFYGNVSRQNPLSCDPTISGQHCDPIDSGDGGTCSPMNPCTNDVATNDPLSTTSSISSTSSSSATSTNMDRERAKEVILAILQHVREQPEDPKNSLYLRHLQNIFLTYDHNGELAQWAGLEGKLTDWINRYMQSTDPTKSPSETNGNGLRGERELFALLGQTAMMIRINRQLHDQQYTNTVEKADDYARFITDNLYTASLWSAKATAWAQQRQFGHALAAYEEIESLSLETPSDKEVAPPDYSRIKQALADSMDARSQSKRLPLSVGDRNSTGTDDIPSSYGVEAAYPNPFNPQTTIPFAVPDRSRVTVEVYNMLGRKVGVLTDREYAAGTHEVRFSGRDLASGVYFIRTEISNKVFNQKVTLVK